MFVNRVATVARDEGKPLVLRLHSKTISSNIDLCAKHSCQNLAMTLWSCKVKKEDKVGAGPQKMVVNLSLIEQYVRAVEHKVRFIFC